MSHTPGPWRAAESTRSVWRTYINADGLRAHQLVCQVVDVARHEAEQLPNTRLIAAAPELLAIVQGLLNPRVGMPSLIAAAKTVMQKVEGQ